MKKTNIQEFIAFIQELIDHTPHKSLRDEGLRLLKLLQNNALGAKDERLDAAEDESVLDEQFHFSVFHDAVKGRVLIHYFAEQSQDILSDEFFKPTRDMFVQPTPAPGLGQNTRCKLSFSMTHEKAAKALSANREAYALGRQDGDMQHYMREIYALVQAFFHYDDEDDCLPVLAT